MKLLQPATSFSSSLAAAFECKMQMLLAGFSVAPLLIQRKFKMIFEDFPVWNMHSWWLTLETPKCCFTFLYIFGAFCCWWAEFLWLLLRHFRKYSNAAVLLCFGANVAVDVGSICCLLTVGWLTGCLPPWLNDWHVSDDNDDEE